MGRDTGEGAIGSVVSAMETVWLIAGDESTINVTINLSKLRLIAAPILGFENAFFTCIMKVNFY